ncbi:formate-dependent phosphoribosylglycinamide formyltransferase [Sulfobacillus thermosulfidooxidans]|uniref:formate-dependent phosphoribosylglycinamide formyltransferase n=1 Tax=Sulfobacillus thermosulfidooxidans TaxID=28034 RepID=UPI00096B6FF3|nr:formate-dependent phosphoribosylglycinamide formyltransferase [Sulfobacillus thermosulfidooxidans]OLZ08498.1 phosphoribosylglycinamide formyltransferase 2 [Sulfobacillus thermosulfidooxidans]OLZ13101.1 phosphoribosylglycinamide formyltransferase 2 [Sulfobacillus thermosulfidooxidans]OLZ21481.1 phosphoribosylglycinamide formyltransferase 2 [Sulfobacillus thermosulfidooxidans]
MAYHSAKLLLLGSGELGKEVLIEAQRLGLYTVAVDRYPDAPAMAVAHKSHVINMTDADALYELIKTEHPDYIVPEIEALSTPTLEILEGEGFRVIPTARAARLTMDREGIRRLAAETLNLPTARYEFANSLQELEEAARHLGFPLVVKPIMSSSGKGQSVCYDPADLKTAWNTAMEAGRVHNQRVIVEEFIAFDSEITVLTVRSKTGTVLCPAIGHRQVHGDYIESWQPHFLTPSQWDQAQFIARAITDALGGLGIFGVELFVTPERVYFSEVSPRPHDTGMVTMVSQSLSEFALHVRAILGFPVPPVDVLKPSASYAIKADHAYTNYRLNGVEDALQVPCTQIRIFAKPTTYPGRRVGVVLAQADTVDEARQRAQQARERITIQES